MANPEHLKILKQGVEVWNKWRTLNEKVEPDLSNINLTGADLSDANLSGVNLSNANLSSTNLSSVKLSHSYLTHAHMIRTKLNGADIFGAYLFNTNLSFADMSFVNLAYASLVDANLANAMLFKADMSFASLSSANLFAANLSNVDLSGANLNNANLSHAILIGAKLNHANFSNADLSNANLEEAILIQTILNNSIMEGAKIYGISAWDIQKDGFIQKDLIITPPSEPEITVDDLEVAQFIYLMLNNQKIRDVIETITSKAVLILGRFTAERKAVLDALKDELRRRNYLPIVFDFENVGSKSVDETVNLLARMSRFVVADITDAKSIPQELRGIVPDNPSIPIVPLIWKEQREYGMFDHFRNYPWVLDLHEYESPEILLHNIIPAIIAPAEQKVAELRGK